LNLVIERRDLAPACRVAASGSRRDRDLQHPITLVPEQFTGLLDVIGLEAEGDHRAQVNARHRCQVGHGIGNQQVLRLAAAMPGVLVGSGTGMPSSVNC
jgi:hypothetical protein